MRDKATATRHLADLLAKGCIEKLAGGGRNTRYKITKQAAYNQVAMKRSSNLNENKHAR